MKAIVTVIGKDRVGIIAEVSSQLAELNLNINDINQTVMQNDFFTMVMLADVSKSSVSFGEISDRLAAKGKEMGLSIKIQLEDIFNAMHRI